MTLPRRGLWIPSMMLAAAAGLPRSAWGRPRPAPDALDPDLAACRELVLRASMRMDANDAEGLASLFTPDLEFVRPATYPEVTIRGRQALRDAIAARPATFVSRHLFSNSLAERVSADRIRVVSYFTHFSGQRGDADQPIPMEHALRSLGDYEDTVVRTSEGWRIARRVARFVFGGL